MKTGQKLVIALLCTAFLWIQISCSKTEQVQKNEPQKASIIEQKFFNTHRTADPIEKKLVEFLERKNLEEHFIEKTVSQIGFPRWDKSISVSKKRNSSKGSDSPAVTYYLPFVRDSQHYVNASMAIIATANDTTIKYLCDWQYMRFYNNTESMADSAEQHALFFMLMDNVVFDYNDFGLTDTTLFRTSVYRTESIHLDIAQSSGNYQRSNVMSAGGPICINYTLNLSECTQCPTNITNQQCWDEYYGVTSGGTGGTGGAGGGGSGGGYTPPQCGGAVSARGSVWEGCGPGWIPAPVLTPAQIQLSSELNTILAPGDYFYFVNNPNPSTSLSFLNVTSFQNYLLNNAASQTSDLSAAATIINQNEKIEHGKFNLTFIGGVDISCKVSKSGSVWQLANVTSSDYGITLGWSWEQTDFAQSTAGNEITLLVEGYVSYNIIVKDLGTLYKQKMKFIIKINNQTGKITSLSKG